MQFRSAPPASWVEREQKRAIWAKALNWTGWLVPADH